MNVTFIGSGNVAWHLAPALDNTDFPVREVFSRNIHHASALVEKLYQATPRATLDFSQSNSHIFVIAASDDAIPEIVNELVLPANAILLHTSGSVPLSALGPAATPNIGVLYPLQTFSKSKKIDWKEVPVFVESENADTERVLVAMAKAVSKKVNRITSSERKALHIAAVFASNFVNHMLTIAKDIASSHKISFDHLKPLVTETITKALMIGPENSQTGPASRGDLEMLDRHMEFLRYDDDLAEIYRIVSQHIVDRYGE
ncbi:MAG TPA: DUF2520 domain-containing protein [Chryseosolibacter sp.]|nr:DUF2520 domain-containing protein [Chryseosolibacter sp.]